MCIDPNAKVSKIILKQSLSSSSISSSSEENTDEKFMKLLSIDEIKQKKIAEESEFPVTFIMSALKPVPMYSFEPTSSYRKALPAKQIQSKSIPYAAVIKGRLPLSAYEPLGVLQVVFYFKLI